MYKVVFIIHNSVFGGYEKRYLKLAHYIFNNCDNIDVRVIINDKLSHYKNDQGDISYILNDNSFNHNIIYCKGKRRAYFSRIINKLVKILCKSDIFILNTYKYIKEFKPDYIITNKDIRHLRIYVKFENIKLIKEFTSPDIVDKFFLNKEYKKINNIDIVSFVSKSVEKRFNRKLIENGIIYTGNKCTAPIPFYINDVIDKAETIRNKQKIIVFAHRLIERKNPMLFVDVAKKIIRQEDFKDWNIYILGKGELSEKIEIELKDEINNGRIVFDYKKDIRPILKKSMLFFSLIEPSSYPSQSILEAMNYGNALVLLDRGESHRFIYDNGVLVEKNADNILDKLSSLKYYNIIKMGSNSLDAMETEFNEKKYLEYFKKMVS